MEEELLQEPEGDQPGQDVIIIFAIFFEGGLAPISLALGWLLGHPPLEQFAWNRWDALTGALATIPLICVFLLIMRWPLGPLRVIRAFWTDEATPLFARTTWLEIAMISISAGIGEEMLFRGVLQASFTSWFGPAAGLSLTSLIFGLLHPISIPYVVLACVIGFYVGLVWNLNGNLLAVMVVHALYDFAVLAYLIRLRQTVETESDAN